MPEQFRNHAEEIAAALRAAAANPCGPHARTLAGAAALLTTPRPQPKPAPAPDLHFAKSVLAMHFTRLYRLFGQEFGAEEADEIRAAVDAIVAEAVTRYTSDLTDDDMERLSNRLDHAKLAEWVNWVGVAGHIDIKELAHHVNLHALAARLRPGIVHEIDLTDLAAVMMPLVLPELDRIARAIAEAKPASVDTPKPPVAERTVDRIMELRGALEQLLEFDAEASSARSEWAPKHIAAVERAEKALGRVPAAVDKHA